MRIVPFDRDVGPGDACPPAVFRHPTGRTLVASIDGSGSIDDGIACARASLRGLGRRWIAACDERGEQAGSSALLRRLLMESVGEAQRYFSERGACDIATPVAAIDIGPGRSVACVGGSATVLLVRAQRIARCLAPRIAAEAAIAEGMSVARAYQMRGVGFSSVLVDCIDEAADPFDCEEDWILQPNDVILVGDYSIWHGARAASGYEDEALPRNFPGSMLEILLSDAPVPSYLSGVHGVAVFLR